MRKLLALWAGKAVLAAGKILKKRTSSAPGEFALRICPDFIKDINKHVKKGIIVTCGTNGKTTTNNLMCTALEALGYKVMCNRIGANMTSGVATAFIEAANIFGKANVDYACFEVDEAYTPIIFSHFTPDMLIVTNLFRDQLDRYGETDTTSAKIKSAIAMAPSIKLVLNGDDPLCVQFSLAENAKSFFYGVCEQVNKDAVAPKEGRFCPVCSSELGYDYYHYSQLGIFKCPSCGFARPEIDFKVSGVKLGSPMEFDINSQHVEINQKGFYNIYNMAAVYGALNVLGENSDNFARLLSAYVPQVGRMQEFMLKKPVIMSLSKNPAGFNQAIETVNTDTRKKDIIIAVNDNAGDGQDVSWLWDVEFEKLVNDTLSTLSVSGKRMWDLNLRFKYVDIKVDATESDMEKLIRAALDTDSEVVYAIVNYTMMYPTEEILNKIRN